MGDYHDGDKRGVLLTLYAVGTIRMEGIKTMKVSLRPKLNQQNTISDSASEVFDAVSSLWIQEKNRLQSSAEMEDFPYSAVIKLTDGCNLSCGYCYISGGEYAQKMSIDTLMEVVSQMSCYAEPELVLYLHGGEPLLCFSMIREMVTRLQSQKSQKPIRLRLQTNGTLITAEHAQFFRSEKIAVGISLDGYEELHNVWRHYRNGKGSFADVWRGISILKEHNVDFGVLVVVTKANIKYLAEILDFFKDNSIYSVCMNPLIPRGRGSGIERNAQVTSEEYFNGMKAVVDWLINYNRTADKEKTMKERNIKWLVRHLTTLKRDYMCFRSPCGAGTSTLSFDINGDFYVCDDFCRDARFKIGNIFDGDIRDMVRNSPAVKQVKQRNVMRIPKCSKCNWKLICCGGCSGLAFYTYNSLLRETPLCGYFKRMIPYLIELFKEHKVDPSLLT